MATKTRDPNYSAEKQNIISHRNISLNTNFKVSFYTSKIHVHVLYQNASVSKMSTIREIIYDKYLSTIMKRFDF